MSRRYSVVDFLPQYRKSLEEKKKKKGSGAWIKFVPLLLVLLAVGGYYGYQQYQIKQTEDNIAALRAYIDSAGTKEKLAAVTRLSKETGELSAEIGEIKDINSYIASFTAPGTAEYLNVRGADEAQFALHITSWSYDRSGGALYLNCEAETAGASALFVKNLRASGGFADVTYYGYEQNSAGIYEFSVVCYLKAVS